VAIECVCQAEIKAAPQVCLQTAADVTGWREWARDLERVTVLAPAEGSGPMWVAITIAILGEEKSATIDLVVDPDSDSLTFELVESASVGEFTGGVRFTGSGARSRMDARVYATLLRPRAARIERMASRKIETALTRDFVRYVERGAGR
jgi:hypothetical protein